MDKAFVSGTGFCNFDILYSDMPRVPIEGEEIYSKGFDVQLGGGVPATMINLARLGVKTKLATFLGDDMFSNFIKSEFDRYNVEYSNVYKGHGIPLSVTSAVITKNDRTFISYRDEQKIDDNILQMVYEMSKGSKVVDMSLGYIDVYKKLKAEGSTLIFDTGWEDDMTIEKYSDYIEVADYYTPNQKEALKMTGTKTAEDALSVFEKYFKCAIVKLDKEGCLISDNGKRSLIPVMKNVNAVDSTGAGDAFFAGLLYGVYHELSFADSVRCGNIIGGTCVEGIGCLSSFIDEKQLLIKLKEMQNY